MGIRKIAEMTGLSTATVSHVLNGTRKVSKASRDKVFSAADSIGYRPNIAARMLRTKKSRTIALIIPSDESNTNANYFYMDVIMGVRKKALETRYEVVVSTYDPHSDQEASLRSAQVLRQRWIDGVIIVPTSLNEAQLGTIRELELPFVLLDRRSDVHFPCVASDNLTGVVEALGLFARCGKRRIGFIGGSGTATGRQRHAGYLEGMRRLGFAVDAGMVLLSGHYSLQNGTACAQALIDAKADAIFAADNVMMMGALRAIRANGLRIPEDVGLIGFDDFDWMENVSPPLTTIKQQTFRMGYAAAEMLIRKIGGSEENETVLLDTVLVVRGSHGAGGEAP